MASTADEQQRQHDARELTVREHNKSLMKQLREADQRREQLEDVAQGLRVQVEEMKRNVSTLSQENVHLKRELKEDIRLATLTVNDLKDEIARWRRQVDSAEEDAKAARQSLAEAKEENARLKLQRSASLSALEERQRAEATAHEQEVTRLQNDLRGEVAMREDAEATGRDLERALESSEADRERLDRECTETARELAAARHELDLIRGELESIVATTGPLPPPSERRTVASVSECLAQLTDLASFLQGAVESDATLVQSVRAVDRRLDLLHQRFSQVVYLMLDLCGRTESDLYAAQSRVQARRMEDRAAATGEEPRPEELDATAPWVQLLLEAGPLQPDVPAGDTSWVKEDPRYKFVAQMHRLGAWRDPLRPRGVLAKAAAAAAAEKADSEEGATPPKPAEQPGAPEGADVPPGDPELLRLRDALHARLLHLENDGAEQAARMKRLLRDSRAVLESACDQAAALPPGDSRRRLLRQQCDYARTAVDNLSKQRRRANEENESALAAVRQRLGEVSRGLAAGRATDPRGAARPQPDQPAGLD